VPFPRRALVIDVEIKRDQSLYQYCDVELTSDLSALKIAHFDTSMSIVPVMIHWKLPPRLQFETGSKPTEIQAHVGTMDKSTGCWTVIDSGDRNFPNGRFNPTITVQFPTNNPDAPITREYTLDKFC
jgi:hypothetical protein